MEAEILIETTADARSVVVAVAKEKTGVEPEVLPYRGLPAETLEMAPLVLQVIANIAIVAEFARSLKRALSPEKQRLTRLRIGKRGAPGDEVMVELDTMDTEALKAVVERFSLL